MENLICECDNFKCVEPLPLTDAEYLALREIHARAAVVLPGHQSTNDVVLKAHDEFLVVRTES